MELNECLKGRRSIRKYSYKEIDKSVIEEIVSYAQLSPSWKNSQTCRFYGVISEEGRRGVINSLYEFNRERASGASAFIITTAVHGRSGFDADGSHSTHLGDGFQYFDNGLAVENLLLKAYEMGFGTLIMGLYYEKELRELLSVPENEKIVSVIALGYADISPEMPQRKELDKVLKIL
ncbi:MAG: nitroreductase family protein [Clostridia bacterium]|nr:nitroreductase family protein [Clostridia bacterium]